MKKIVSLAILVGLTAPAVAAPSYLTRTGDGGYRVTYNYTDKAKTGWYVGGRAELGFWNWKNKYDTSDNFQGDKEYGTDDFSFEPVFGGSLFGGTRFAYFWRAELELGYLGYFEDADVMAQYSLQIPYAMANLYYDFTNGLYVGAGVGAAMPIEKIDLVGYADGTDRTEYGFAPMAGIMLGYSYELDENLVLDLRYRLSGMTGYHHRVDDLVTEDDDLVWFENEVDFILDNSISIGIRYEF